MSMKILNVNYAFGTLTLTLNDELFNILELKKQSHDVVMVTSDSGSVRIRQGTKNEKLPLKEDTIIEMCGIPTYVLHSTIPQAGWYCSGAKKLAKKIIKDYDVVYIHNWYDHLPFVFSKEAYKHKIPYVFNPHGTIHSEARKKYKRELKWVIDKLYTHKMIRRASALHASGESEKMEFLKMGSNSKKIFRIDPTVVKENFEIKKRTNILNRLNIDKNNKPYILFLSRIHKKKGIEVLLQAFAKLNSKNISLIIAGTGEEKYTKKIQELVKKLKLENSVKLAGYVIGDEKLQLLESAKMFVLPSYSDVHPASITEAIMMRTPTLITKNCDYQEVEEYKVGKIVESTVNSFHEGLKEMLKDDKKLAEFSVNSKKLIEEKFDFKIEKFEDMFNYAIKSFKTN